MGLSGRGVPYRIRHGGGDRKASVEKPRRAKKNYGRASETPTYTAPHRASVHRTGVNRKHTDRFHTTPIDGSIMSVPGKCIDENSAHSFGPAKIKMKTNHTNGWAYVPQTLNVL